MKRFLVVLGVLVAVAASAKFFAVGSTLVSTSGSEAAVCMPATSGPGVPVWAGVRCDAPATVQTGTAGCLADGGYTLSADGGMAGVAAGVGDPYIFASAPERLLELAPGENAVAIAGWDGGSANCWVSWAKEF
jgi:hypothetical protein